MMMENCCYGRRELMLLNMIKQGFFGKIAHCDDKELMETVFNQGDVITTVIKCAHGESIKLTLATTLPRYYSRGLTVYGTDAFFSADTKTVVCDGDFTEENESKWMEENLGNEEKYLEKYEHPIWKKYQEEGVREGHGGMDWLVISAFFDALKKGEPMPIDVYDMASWMAITPLSEKSIQLGSSPVEIPDFTNGKWCVK